jgi:hypothetical protein
MAEIKQICVHHLHGNCKYENKCSKMHIEPYPELFLEIEKKGNAVCMYYPNCKFNSDECKRIHIMERSDNNMNELSKYYYKLLELKLTDPEQIQQINRIKYMIQHDLMFIKDTYDVLTQT